MLPFSRIVGMAAKHSGACASVWGRGARSLSAVALTDSLLLRTQGGVLHTHGICYLYDQYTEGTCRAAVLCLQCCSVVRCLGAAEVFCVCRNRCAVAASLYLLLHHAHVEKAAVRSHNVNRLGLCL